jgi:hypothetical protein
MRLAMLDVFDALDQAEVDPVVLNARWDYLADKITANELDATIGKRQNEILWGDEYTVLAAVVDDARSVHAHELLEDERVTREEHARAEAKAAIDEDLRVQQQRAEADSPTAASSDAELYGRIKQATLRARK